jgi:hypothetical protein
MSCDITARSANLPGSKLPLPFFANSEYAAVSVYAVSADVGSDHRLFLQRKLRPITCRMLVHMLSLVKGSRLS